MLVGGLRLRGFAAFANPHPSQIMASKVHHHLRRSFAGRSIRDRPLPHTLVSTAEPAPVDSPNPSPGRYVVPQALRDVELIDMLEICGSATRAAAAVLHLSQPTVSRRYQSIARDLDLSRRSSKDPGLRFGDGPYLRLLRQALNKHRWQAGLLRVGCRRGLETALAARPQLQALELSHHPPVNWWELVKHQLLDGLVLDDTAAPAGFDGPAGDPAWGPCPSAVVVVLALPHRRPLRLLCRRHAPILSVAERLQNAGPWVGSGVGRFSGRALR
jgi:hypothetical protein